WTATTLATLDGAAKALVSHGEDLVVACADGALVALRRDGDGRWTTERLDQAPAGLARLGSDGERLLVARDDGALALYAGGRVDVVHQEGNRLRGAVFANVDVAAPGLELATAGYGR